MGITIGEDCLFNIQFADDQAVIAQDSYDLEFMLTRLYKAYETWGLNVNVNKTEYLVVNSDARFEVLIKDSTSIEQVDEFKYLGALITREGLGKPEIKKRIEQSRKVLGSLNSIWWDKHISRATKIHIGKAFVESVLSYGCEVWTLSTEIIRQLNAVEMDYLRRSAGVSRRERITSEEIRRRMHAEDTIINRVERRGLKWFGHLLRMDEQRWPRKIFQWRPPGRGKRGRPRLSWYENMRKAMEHHNLAEEDAQDRNRWRLGVGMRQ